MNNRGRIRLRSIIYFIVIIIIIWVGVNIYSTYNYYDYVKGVREAGKTTFTRDSEVTYSDMHSYKIENKEYNDAMFYKEINVIPYTAYKVTCMVKTDSIENEENSHTGGAQIAINQTTEASDAVSGTNDWTKLTLMFNSNGRSTVQIGFRLGGYNEYSKGTAWFSDFKIEEGSVDTDKNWNMACFIIKNIDVNISENRRVKLEMSEGDIVTVEDNMRRLKNNILQISGGKMTISYDIIEINKPLTDISYDEENEYYVSPGDVQELIEPYMDEKEYDYIYVAIRTGDLNKSDEVLVHDWIGLRSNGI